MERDFSKYEILNALCDPVAVINSEGIIVSVNQAWKKFSADNEGLETETCVGVNYFNVCSNIAGPDRDTAMAAVEGIKKVISGALNDFEIEYPCDSPSEKRWFIMKATRLSADGNLCLLLHQNISRRKFAEIDLQRKNLILIDLNESLNKTVYQLAHDIQAPLNSIKGVISLNREKIISLEHTLELIETSIKTLSQFLEETVKAALEPSRDNLTEIDFNELVKEVIASVKYQNANVIINYKIKCTQPFYSYINELRIILSNIVTNSLKYSDKNKTKQEVDIIIASGDTSACIVIRDNGIGIDESSLNNIFNFKYQENAKSPGFGLGLHLVKHSLDKLHGSFTVKSELGKGTQFTFDIPNISEVLEASSFDDIDQYGM